MAKFVFSDKNAVCAVGDNGNVVSFESGFINGYIENLMKSNSESDWKRQGVGAKFTMAEEYEPKVNPEELETSVNGLDFLDEDNIIYSASVADVSGIYKKNIKDAKEKEGHIIHRQDLEFKDLALSADKTKIVMSVKTDALREHIAVFDLQNDDFYILTDGDSRDGSPSFAKENDRTIYYSSCGIGRDKNGNFVEYGKSDIYSYDTLYSRVEEVYSDKEFSCVQPKDDGKGNMYFITRPVKEKLKKPNILLQILLIPFKIIYAIYKFLEAFTMIFTGKSFTTRTEGDNPGKNKSDKDAVVDGYRIEYQKNYEKCMKRKEKFPGYAPKEWKLNRLSLDGSVEVLAEGVLSYCLTKNGVVYTNGKSLISLNNGGEKIADARFATAVAACE